MKPLIPADISESQLRKSLESLHETVQRAESAKIYQLALWTDPQRGVPNEFVRSALFPAIQPNKAKYVEGQTLFGQDGFSITFTGKQLTQSDLDVYEGIMHIARGLHEGNKIRFTTYQLLKLIDRDTGRSQHQWLLRVLQRLTATSLAITRDGKKVFWGSLLPKGAADMEDGKFSVEVSREMVKLFSRGYTVIEWHQRRALGKKPLAQALHGWICSHAKPYPVSVQYLRDLTGSETRELKHFRASLRVALDAVQETGAIASWRIDSRDKVHIAKDPAARAEH